MFGVRRFCDIHRISLLAKKSWMMFRDKWVIENNSETVIKQREIDLGNFVRSLGDDCIREIPPQGRFNVSRYDILTELIAYLSLVRNIEVGKLNNKDVSSLEAHINDHIEYSKKRGDWEGFDLEKHLDLAKVIRPVPGDKAHLSKDDIMSFYFN